MSYQNYDIALKGKKMDSNVKTAAKLRPEDILSFFSTSLNVNLKMKKTLNNRVDVQAARTDLSRVLPQIIDTLENRNKFLRSIEFVHYRKTTDLDRRKFNQLMQYLINAESVLKKIDNPKLRFEKNILFSIGDSHSTLKFNNLIRPIQRNIKSLQKIGNGKLSLLKSIGYFKKGNHIDQMQKFNIIKLNAACKTLLKKKRLKIILNSLDNLVTDETNPHRLNHLNLTLVCCLSVGQKLSQKMLNDILG